MCAPTRTPSPNVTRPRTVAYGLTVQSRPVRTSSVTTACPPMYERSPRCSVSAWTAAHGDTNTRSPNEVSAMRPKSSFWWASWRACCVASLRLQNSQGQWSNRSGRVVSVSTGHLFPYEALHMLDPIGFGEETELDAGKP